MSKCLHTSGVRIEWRAVHLRYYIYCDQCFDVLTTERDDEAVEKWKAERLREEHESIRWVDKRAIREVRLKEKHAASNAIKLKLREKRRLRYVGGTFSAPVKSGQAVQQHGL